MAILPGLRRAKRLLLNQRSRLIVSVVISLLLWQARISPMANFSKTLKANESSLINIFLVDAQT